MIYYTGVHRILGIGRIKKSTSQIVCAIATDNFKFLSLQRIYGPKLCLTERPDTFIAVILNKMMNVNTHLGPILLP